MSIISDMTFQDSDEQAGIHFEVHDYGLTRVYIWDEQGNNAEHFVETERLTNWLDQVR